MVEKGEPKKKRAFEINLKGWQEHLRVKRDILEEIAKIKEFFGTVKAEIKDSKLTVDVTDKGDIEIELGIKALLKRKGKK